MKRNAIFAIGLVAAVLVGFEFGKQSSVDALVETSSQTGVAVDYLRAEKTQSAQTFSQPVIGIASLTSDSYVRAIRECGGIPIVLPNTDGSSRKIDDYLVLLDGIANARWPGHSAFQMGRTPASNNQAA